MAKSKWYAEGKSRGRSIASWVDIPEIGSQIPRELDWVGYGEVTADNIRDVIEMIALDGESGSRDYSPFEVTAHAINESRDPDKAWSDFDEGILAGVRKEISSRFARSRKRRR